MNYDEEVVAESKKGKKRLIGVEREAEREVEKERARKKETDRQRETERY